VCDETSPQLYVQTDPPLSRSLTVMVSTEITDGEGSKAQPCAVAVTVMPRYHGDDCSGEDL
jgi:polycystin 1L1